MSDVSQDTVISKEVGGEAKGCPHVTAQIADRFGPAVHATYAEVDFGPDEIGARAHLESAWEKGLLLPTGPLTDECATEGTGLSVAALGRS